MDYLRHHVEALIFCSPKPISVQDILACLREMFDVDVPQKDIEQSIEDLRSQYERDRYSFSLVESGGGYQFLTKPAYQVSIGILLKQQSKKRLSNSALETLAIIAYKQPVTKNEIEQIRGVNCDYAVQKLLEKELLEVKGKSEGIGRPILYGTSKKFMDYFGINDIKDLPMPKDFKIEDSNTIGKEE